MSGSGWLGVRLRPVVEADLAMFRRFLTEPGLIGPDWAGFRDAGEPARRFAADGYLGADDGRLTVEVDRGRPGREPDDASDDQPADAGGAGDGGRVAAGFVSFLAGSYGGSARHWEIGIALLPEWRGRGVGWRAQAMLCDYLFSHTPVQRVQAGTQPENVAEQAALTRAGFQFEGVVRACEFRAGQWRDGYLYSRLRDDPSPW
ncbi:GNAT family N-acetyltransferase [Micromonospora sagamiensis]|uniref:Acetyltransferase (GNAT) family protein n=1 Tax=Micromonospora sagamiensis TaxID=47875 RepID=A0A562WHR8_9ACTN|nr:GNAT family protein [Micromonospora sagamiensis]TWJ29859.1 acetyltransferase (GNAT) family protein [Micromonospora sagamiensis]BCL17112.1 alanine acetyltransferase [Micromonospora sagamiensis]